MSSQNSFPSLHTDGDTTSTTGHVVDGTSIIKTEQPAVTQSFREYVASILDAVAQGKPVEYREHHEIWQAFDQAAERRIGFNFRHYEYRIKKETHTDTCEV